MHFLNYNEQAAANIRFLKINPEYHEKYKALKDLSLTLKKDNVNWALSCSASLFLQGIQDEFNDLDILIDMKDVDKVKAAIERIGGSLIETKQKKGFKSPYYQEAFYNDIHLDLIGDMTLTTFNTEYKYPVSKEEIIDVNLDNNISVPVCPIEANLLLYGMMIGWDEHRKYKTKLCYNYLKETGVKYPNIIERDYDVLPQGLQELCKMLSPITYSKTFSR